MPVDSVDGVDNSAVHEKKRKKKSRRARLRLPFLCVQVIGCPKWEVEPHPSEPFE